MRQKTLLVTGAAGFIGSNYLHFLYQNYRSDFKIINVDALTYAGNLQNLSMLSDWEGYEFIHCRIQNQSELMDHLQGKSIDAIINFAAESHVDRSILGSRDFIETNVLGTQSLLDIARALGVPKFVQVSTDEVYGTLGETGAFSETMPLEPNSPYSASKAGGDLLVRSYVETHGMNACITRCSNNYGPYQFPEKLIPLMIHRAQNDQPLPVYGHGAQIRDWIYVEDHCRGVHETLLKGEPGQIYNFGGHAERKNIDVVRAILAILGKPDSLISYVKDRPGHDFRYAMDTSKVEALWGWTPSITFENGLERTVSWYLTHQDWFNSVLSGSYQSYYQTQYGQH